MSMDKKKEIRLQLIPEGSNQVTGLDRWLQIKFISKQMQANEDCEAKSKCLVWILWWTLS